MCSEIDHTKRENMEAISKTLLEVPVVECLRISHATALEDFDFHVARDGESRMPENDGSNACTFLALKFAIEKRKSTAAFVEEVITKLPEKLNLFHDMAEYYDVLAALKVMKSSGADGHQSRRKNYQQKSCPFPAWYERVTYNTDRYVEEGKFFRCLYCRSL